MLKKILGKLEPGAAADEKVYKKLKCWYNTNDREPTSASDSGKQLDTDLTSKIEGKTAASAKLSTGAKNLQSDIASKQQSLDEAAVLRKKQLASFTQEEMELFGALSAPHVRDHGVEEAPHGLCADASRGGGEAAGTLRGVERESEGIHCNRRQHVQPLQGP